MYLLFISEPVCARACVYTCDKRRIDSSADRLYPIRANLDPITIEGSVWHNVFMSLLTWP